jgi:SAM-dependent methyltransferase
MNYSILMKKIFKRSARTFTKIIPDVHHVFPPPPTGIAPLISSHNPAYLSAISIKGDNKPFERLGPAQEYLGGEVYTDLTSLIPLEAIGQYLERDTYCLPSTADRENYHGERHYDWWLSGLHDFLLIQNKLKEHGALLGAGDSVFELGCASGRVLRHFAIQRQDLECWGADIKLRHVEWMRLFLPAHLKIFQNTVLPHLPIEDNSLSLVTAFSVFTHVDDLELAWLAEIRRILKPGGFFYATIHSEQTWESMKPGVPIYDALMQMQAHIRDYNVSESLLNGPLPKEKTVLYWDTAQNYNCNVFHHTDYVRREWGRFFDIAEIIPAESGYQDVVLLRKPA